MEDRTKTIVIVLLSAIIGVFFVVFGVLTIPKTDAEHSMKTLVGMINIMIGTWILLMVVNPFLKEGLRRLSGDQNV
jgi:hypothetical protein